MMAFLFLSLGLLWLPAALCHPGQDTTPEARARSEYLSRHPRMVKDCRAEIKDEASSIRRRANSFKDVASDHGIDIPIHNVGKPYYAKKDLHAVLSMNHEAGTSKDDEELLLFADYSSYALQPFVTPGPYFVSGELIRSDIRESQVGIPLVLEIQFINTRTCQPIEGLYVEVWQANATGVYSGVASFDNGNSVQTLDLDENDTGKRKMTGGILNESWLRGVQQTGTDGVVRFKTIFPGWYNGRATHIHLLAHNPSSAKQLPNHTVASESPGTHSVRASHVGQIFFDATLLDRVAETHPYKSNAQWRIKNEEDAVLMEEGNISDPMVQYVTLGSSIETGIFGWIAIGIDPQVDVEVKIAATWFGTWGRMWRKLWH